MYSELLDQVVLVPSMSNSEVFLIKGDQEGVEFDILKRPQMPEFQGDQSRGVSTGAAVAGSHDDPELTRRGVEDNVIDHDQNKKKKKKKKEEEEEQVGYEQQPHNVKRLGLGEFNATTSDHDDEDEGFRTPTSLDHKIPEIKQCPPAPRKPMPPFTSKKRKSSSVSVSTSLRYSDLSQEVESLFPKPILDDLHRKIKKARTVLEEEDKEKSTNQRF